MPHSSGVAVGMRPPPTLEPPSHQAKRQKLAPLMREFSDGDLLLNTYSSPSTSGDTVDGACFPSVHHGFKTHGKSSRSSHSKSAKRKAAEALLERKAIVKQLDERSTSAPPGLPVEVPACSSACDAGAARTGRQDVDWCSMRLSIPPLEWPRLLRTLAAQHSHAGSTASCLPGGLQVRLVECAEDLGPALADLRQSMQDSVIGLDLEWRPDHRPGSANRVALIQLASASMAVLVRCCKMRFQLPAALRHFFSDAAITFVSFSWESSDEDKFSKTFGIGRTCFARFADLQCVAESLGYHSLGLAKLTERVLGVALPKSRKVSVSNWETYKLTPAQVHYAALDALMTGHVFRGLRLWHASPSACPACRQLLGLVPAAKAVAATCAQCSKSCKNLQALLSHARSTGHAGGTSECGQCGRMYTGKPCVAGANLLN